MLEKQWFAVEYHLRRVLRDDPENDAVKTRLGQLAYMIAYDQRFALAARLLAEALGSDPKLGDAPRTHARYNAARAATMAAAGQGQGEPPLDNAAKMKLRRQALDWLKAELSALDKFLPSGQPQDIAAIVQDLQHRKKDSDLSGIRDAMSLSNLTEAERNGFQALWTEVEALLERAQKPKP